jgi:hypothetical protein
VARRTHGLEQLRKLRGSGAWLSVAIHASQPLLAPLLNIPALAQAANGSSPQHIRSVCPQHQSQ